MSKPRKPTIPRPGSKTKPSVPVLNALSQEFVDSGDDSSDEVREVAQSKKTATRKTKTPVQIAVHRPKPSGAVKEPVKVAKKQKEKETVESTSKAKPEPKKPAPKKVVAEKNSASSSSSSEESEDESETDTKKAPQRTKEKAASTSDSDSDDSSEESEDEPAPTATSKAVEKQSKPTPTRTHNVEFVAARPYVPPKNFRPAPTQRAQSTPQTALFENLAGKQLWHITAPEGVSLKQLKELAMEQALKGKAVLKHKDANYGFLPPVEEDNDTSSREVIVPRLNGYRAVSARISHTFHLREQPNLPKLSSLQADPNTGSEAAASITQSTIRAPRPQVKGLKMRYFPSGVYDHAPATLGSDDEEIAPPTRNAGLAVPNVVHLPVGKRKLSDAAGERVENPTKKVKKHRTPEEKKAREEKRARKEKRKASATS